MSARELYEWSAFEENFGPITIQERIDHAAALQSWCALRAAGAKGVKIEDLMPDWSKPRRDQSDEEMMSNLLATTYDEG